MKIRIKGNSLRYRLTKSDVSRFEEDGYIEESTHFAQHTLIYALQTSTDNHLTATFENDKITLYMPEVMAFEWTTGETVGYEYKNDDFYLLVEKDFKCLDIVDEDQSDNYPNPLNMLR